MAHDAVIARSFGRFERKKLVYGAFVLVLSFCAVFRLRVLHQRVSNPPCFLQEPKQSQAKVLSSQLKLLTCYNTDLMVQKLMYYQMLHFQLILRLSNVSIPPAVLENTMAKQEEQRSNSTIFQGTASSMTDQLMAENVMKQREPPCHVMDLRSDLYNITGEVRIQANSSTVFIPFPEKRNLFRGYNSWKIRPYSRNKDLRPMNGVREWSLIPAFSDVQVPQCTRNHTIVSILFSTGGYAGNHFHDFSDIIIPLYLTSRSFNGKVQFLISENSSWWVMKFRAILQNLSYYPIIHIDQEEDVHCFPSIVMGLQRHGELHIDHSMSPYTMRDFREFLRSTYSLTRRNAVRLRHGDTRKPRLLVISRKRTRSFTNSTNIAETAESMGFEVIVAGGDIHIVRFAEIVNSCDLVMGIHGAVLINALFLPDSAVMIQVVPLGGVELVAKTYFGVPSKEMNLRYLEYKIGTKEITLIEQFPLDHMALKNPYSLHRCNLEAFKSAYLDKQNVTIDVRRFKPTLLKALELLHE
ncbi:beta-1,2-xylosyltransferase XYXT1-like [Rhodamnia argentea]|uniref:Beta-1,2-xylosyltransferase XYXT1-like n=1 Tax=Rhodamnia argentea TaxID=178133 RepID=A0ABM3HCM6_9MYRT|nr:beta-1,2-xylosyltransferase XYXT1-like [Rhodamnia argentea]